MSDHGTPALVRRTMHAALACALVATVPACQDHDFEAPSREERVSAADSLYSAAFFDTIAWETPQDRALAGNGVYAAECRKCHGPLGHGDTAYEEEQGLDVPSLVTPDWEYGGSTETVRRRIFTGHADGMPTWGVAGISPREIDAVAHYITEVLRPDVLGDMGEAPPQEP